MHYLRHHPRNCRSDPDASLDTLSWLHRSFPPLASRRAPTTFRSVRFQRHLKQEIIYDVFIKRRLSLPSTAPSSTSSSSSASSPLVWCPFPLPLRCGSWTPGQTSAKSSIRYTHFCGSLVMACRLTLGHGIEMPSSLPFCFQCNELNIYTKHLSIT